MKESGLSAELMDKIQNDGYDPIYDKCPDCTDYADEEHEVWNDEIERYITIYRCPNGHEWKQ